MLVVEGRMGVAGGADVAPAAAGGRMDVAGGAAVAPAAAGGGGARASMSGPHKVVRPATLLWLLLGVVRHQRDTRTSTAREGATIATTGGHGITAWPLTGG